MAADRLSHQVRHWDRPRWSAGTPPPGDLVFALVQSLADAAADAQARPRRVVPRLDTDLVLPDQLEVMVRDLLAAGAPPAILDGAVELIRTTARALDAMRPSSPH